MFSSVITMVIERTNIIQIENNNQIYKNMPSEKVFNYLDLNGDGLLEEKELVQGLQLFG